MGKVVVAARIENNGDIEMRERSALPPDQVRSVEIGDALVATSALGLMLPKHLIEKLGLRYVRTRRGRGIGGTLEVRYFSPVRLIVLGRECTMDVGEVPDGSPVLLGQLPLEAMDFVIDLKTQRLMGNPAHDGEWIVEVY